MTATQQSATDFPHLDACAQTRALDVTEHDGGVVTEHCVDCGAHRAISAAGEILANPNPTGAFAIDEDDKPGIFDGIAIEHALTDPPGRRTRAWPKHP